MIITEEIKNKIIENKIILEKDWPKLEDAHILLAKAILDFSESQDNNESMSEFEQIQFVEEFSEIQDKIELENIFKVKTVEEKEKEMSVVSIRMPASFARFIREEIFPKMIEDLNNS